jgi:hypothetical protein
MLEAWKAPTRKLCEILGCRLHGFSPGYQFTGGVFGEGMFYITTAALSKLNEHLVVDIPVSDGAVRECVGK